MDADPRFVWPSDDNMVVAKPAVWYEYDTHPNKGYWAYEIEGKANLCPEDFLTPYVEGKEEYTEELPCHVYFKQGKV